MSDFDALFKFALVALGHACQLAATSGDSRAMELRRLMRRYEAIPPAGQDDKEREVILMNLFEYASWVVILPSGTTHVSVTRAVGAIQSGLPKVAKLVTDYTPKDKLPTIVEAITEVVMASTGCPIVES